MPSDPAALINRTCQHLVEQRTIPISPGRVDGEATLLCAGAALVREAVMMFRSEEDASAFEREVVANDSGYIREVGAKLGLASEMVDSVIITNDSLTPETRLAGTTEFLSQFLPESRGLHYIHGASS